MMCFKCFISTWILFYPFLGFEWYQLLTRPLFSYKVISLWKIIYLSVYSPCVFFCFCFLYLLHTLLQVLYHVLGVVPSYQAAIGSALNELCLGLQPNEVASVRASLVLLELLLLCSSLLTFKHVTFFFPVTGFTWSVHKRCSCENGLFKCCEMHSCCLYPFSSWEYWGFNKPMDCCSWSRKGLAPQCQIKI